MGIRLMLMRWVRHVLDARLHFNVETLDERRKHRLTKTGKLRGNLGEPRFMGAGRACGSVNRRGSLTPDRRPIWTPPQHRGQGCPGSEQEGPARSGATTTSPAQRSAGGACVPTGASRGDAQARFLKRQLSLPVSMISQ
jgi:hypothetical protein